MSEKAAKSSRKARSVQDEFLSRMAGERRRVTVFLVNGAKIEGEIESFDDYVILMKAPVTDGVYKHAVSTIQPAAEGSARGGPRRGPPRGPTIIRRTSRLARGAGGPDRGGPPAGGRGGNP